MKVRRRRWGLDVAPADSTAVVFAAMLGAGAVGGVVALLAILRALTSLADGVLGGDE